MNNLKHFYRHTTQVQLIFSKVFNLFLNSVNVSLFFTNKGRLFHKILHLKRNDFIPKQYVFTCGNWRLFLFLRLKGSGFSNKYDHINSGFKCINDLLTSIARNCKYL